MIDDVSLELLKQTKLTPKQASIYLAVLQLGQAGVSQIAALAGLKRPSTYIALAELGALGYVTKVPSVKKQTYTAIDPNALASELDRTAAEFREMLPYLRAVQRRAGKPYITYFTGVEGARRAFAQIRRPKEARYAVSIRQATQFIPGEVARWKKIYLQGKTRPGGRHLLTNTTEDRAYGRALIEGRQIVRYLKENFILDMDLALVDNSVYLTSFDDAVHVTVIESPPLYRSLCHLYDLAWNAAQR